MLYDVTLGNAYFDNLDIESEYDLLSEDYLLLRLFLYVSDLDKENELIVRAFLNVKTLSKKALRPSRATKSLRKQLALLLAADDISFDDEQAGDENALITINFSAVMTDVNKARYI